VHFPGVQHVASTLPTCGGLHSPAHPINGYHYKNEIYCGEAVQLSHEVRWDTMRQAKKSSLLLLILLGLLIGSLGFSTDRIAVASTAEPTSKSSVQESKHIAFEVFGNQDTEIHIIDTKGNESFVIKENRVIDTNFAWSPDGKNIAFNRAIGTPSKGSFVHIFGMDSREIRPLVEIESWSPTWSPDSNSIAFMSHGGIYKVAKDGSGLEQVARAAVFSGRNVKWAPKSSLIAFVSSLTSVGEQDLFLLDLDTKNVQRLTTLNAKIYDFSWSPDEKYIIFTSDKDSKQNRNIYRVDLATRSQIRLTNTKGDNDGAIFSPDGQHIVFVSGNSAAENIYVMTFDGENEKKLTEGNFSDNYPAWSSDGTTIAFASDRNGRFNIYTLNMAKTSLVQLTSSDFSESPLHLVWQP
jgi:Tol biopolymer transport system component